ncbi:MAG: 2-oxoglutarate ferredoxin oxidoreductase subunit gamma [Deltaproteobacteria bacterium CG_4_8_14_3_um_filter_51_11]|nr:2-oxoacid:ferredoxin oxidoreductase subunit gamma [bacterium]PIP46911.1 MAG: 2-oxoglutarate ferredoxin oxidoreductase subunit gamma [Deltaproteobacteria bacterium CG23_combo_of_CG06-09_8_20_14_all_51_20]PIX20262.1 MAG: 2-oxoglutarate ferredoxin oxidoreductase subunit gamma [Deltaproteobacteria bacterium CG_4_8_14_3_um_filter_51_11]PIY21997.1 MAG: 2-oxoglutarate ferredoxin oxidoreductase subunit gamma [Deltaproteobacteria bacterium CG_4_10_14_3_um_filter_51_14]PJB37675.1 MAG: 2-oxoglutarate f
MSGRRYEVRLSGSGGQGIIMAAILLAEGAAVYGGKQVAQTQSYGPEARGGASKAEVVISNEPIDYPKALVPDLLLAMNQASCDLYSKDIKREGIIIIDSTNVGQPPPGRTIAIPFTGIARREIGKEFAANMVALGAVSCLCPEVTEGAVEAALMARVPPGTRTLNLKAFKTGVKEARKIDTAKLRHRYHGEEAEV